MKKILFLCFCLLSLSTSFSQTNGQLDTSFGVNGSVIYNQGLAQFNTSCHAVQTDGKIVIAGYFWTAFNDNAMGFLTRLNADGSIDQTFNNGEKIICEYSEGFNAVVIQSDNKIVLGGGYKNNNSLYRFNSNGTIDTSFGTNGYVIAPIPNPTTNDFIISLDVQSNQKIVALVKYWSGSNLYAKVVKYNINGSVDTTFAANGTLLSPPDEVPVNVVVQDDNKIVFGTTYFVNFSNKVSKISKVNPDGSADTTFNSTGAVVLAVGGTDNNLFDLQITSDSKIMALSVATNTLTNAKTIKVFKIGTTGALESNFGSEGVVTLPNNAISNAISKIKLFTDGKFIIACRNLISGENYNLSLYKGNADGTLDTTFDGDGTLILDTNAPNYDLNLDVTVQNSKIIISGNSLPAANNPKIFVANLNSDGSYNTAFNSTGTATIEYPSFEANDVTKSIVIQPDGKVLVSGGSYMRTKKVQFVFRFNPDGSPDTAFGTLGRVVLGDYNNYGLFDDQLPNAKIVLQSDGKIVIAGFERLFRLNANGTFDSNFGMNGILSTPGYFTKSIAVQNDNKLVIAGNFYNTTSYNYNTFVSRLTTTGSYDVSFGTNGTALQIVPSVFEVVYDVKIQSDGKIIAGGLFSQNGNQDMLICKYTASGTLDTSFNGTGRLLIPRTGNEYITSLDVQNDNKIVAAFSKENLEMVNFALVRVTENGALDTTFDSDGIVETSIENSSIANEVKILNDQKIVAIGTSLGTSRNYAFAKFNTDGSLDTTFGTQGKITVDINNGTNENAAAAVLSTDGKMYVAGTIYNPLYYSNDYILSKFNLENNLGTTNPNAASVVYFYPNPTTDFVYLNDSVQNLTVSTLEGKSVALPLYDNTIDFSGLSNAMYLIQFETSTGEKINKKILKE